MLRRNADDLFLFPDNIDPVERNEYVQPFGKTRNGASGCHFGVCLNKRSDLRISVGSMLLREGTLMISRSRLAIHESRHRERNF